MLPHPPRQAKSRMTATKSRNIHTSTLLALVLSAQACADARHTDIDEPRDRSISGAVSAEAEQTISGAVSTEAEELGEDPHRVALAHQIPGFGGIYYEAPGSDRIVIAIAESATADFAKAQEAARDYLMARVDPPATHVPPVEFVRRTVEYSFMELARHRARLRPRVFEVSGVVSLDVDESANRIAIGVSDESAMAVVRDLARGLAIPSEMLSFQEESMAVPSYARGEDRSSLASDGSTFPTSDSLNGSVPDGKLQGGYEIAARGKDACTLGFTALGVQNGIVDVDQWYFVTASHCSSSPFELDEELFRQPRYGEPAGHEYVDLRPHPCPWDNSIFCRWADATLVRADAGLSIWPGIIGRPMARAINVTCEPAGDCPNAELEVDTANPHLRVVGVKRSVMKNEELDKVGRTTGWTYGYVKKGLLADSSGQVEG